MEAQQIRDTLENSGFTEQQPVGLTTVLSNLATKQDVAELRTEMHQEFGKLRSEIYELLSVQRSEMHKLLQAQRSEFHQELGKLRGEMWWKMSLLLIGQAGLIVSLIKLT